MKNMLRWTLTFLVVAVISAVFGFGGIITDTGAIVTAKILFFIFLVFFVLSLLFGALGNYRD